MKFSFLSRSTYSVFIVLLCLLLLLGSWLLLLIVALFFAAAVFLFRCKENNYYEDQLTTAGSLYSPVSGKVVRCDVNDDGTVAIYIKTQFYDQYGIYLPFSCKIENVVFDRDFYTYRFSSSFTVDSGHGLLLELSDKKGRRIDLQFIRFLTGRLPEIVVLPGDRGRRQVNIGYLPYGGITKLTAPGECETVVIVGDRVVAAETILARFKEEVKQ